MSCLHLFLYRQEAEGLRLHFCFWIKEFDYVFDEPIVTDATKAAVPLQCACSRSDWTSAGATQPDDKEVRCVLSIMNGLTQSVRVFMRTCTSCSSRRMRYGFCSLWPASASSPCKTGQVVAPAHYLRTVMGC